MWFTAYINLMLGIPLQSVFFLCLDLKGYIGVTARGTFQGQMKTKGLFVGIPWFLTWLEEFTRQSLHFTGWIKMLKDLFPKHLRSQLQGLELFLSLQPGLVGSKAGKESFYNRTAQKMPWFHCSDHAYESIHLQPWNHGIEDPPNSDLGQLCRLKFCC